MAADSQVLRDLILEASLARMRLIAVSATMLADALDNDPATRLDDELGRLLREKLAAVRRQLPRLEASIAGAEASIEGGSH
jgi:hypothetical protein